jgi:hypothetical protein
MDSQDVSSLNDQTFPELKKIIVKQKKNTPFHDIYAPSGIFSPFI